MKKIQVTEKAKEVIQQLREQHGELMFHLSGGCCDGSVPMCFRKGEFRIGNSDVQLGEVEGVPFYISRVDYAYWQHTPMLLDVTEGRGASFSLEIPLGVRFLIRF